jgi:hypothetical protein
MNQRARTDLARGTDSRALRRLLERERIKDLRASERLLQRYQAEGRDIPERDDAPVYRPQG